MSCVLFLLALLLCACSATAADVVDWWESATLFHLYPRSFMDSDGDGVGDLQGAISRLEYLKEIGITAAWLSPIYESPMADMGYDVANYTNIDPLFGTMEDFDELITKAHKLGLKIILDFVPNHTSEECEWFQKSIRREDGYDDFYVWEDGKIDERTGERSPPTNWQCSFGGSAWTWNEERQQYYLHQFLEEQPDLNYETQMVHEHMNEVLEFWLDRGVDSFRIDAVPFFFEKRMEDGTFADEPMPGDYTQNHPDNPKLLYEWREVVDNYQKVHGGETRMLLAEAYTTTAILSTYVTNGTHNGTQLPINFNFVELAEESTAQTLQEYCDDWMNTMWTEYQMANWDVSNHDNSRLATRMGQNRADTINMIVHALPGASITYYGEEIGMPDGPVETDNFRDPERTPMQWDSTTNAGFSTGNSTWLPVNPIYTYLNAKDQRAVARSSLNIFKQMVKLKKTAAFQAFKEDGGFSYSALSEQVFQVVRTAVGVEEYRLLANLGNQIEYIDSLTNKTMEYYVLNSYSLHKYRETIDLSGRIYLMPYETVVLRWVA